MDRASEDQDRIAQSREGLGSQVGHTGQPPRPAWIEVDLGRHRRNLRLIRAELGTGAGWLAAVKADAYGHGAVPIARQALEEGANRLGVATLAEAATLRDAGIHAPILLLGERHPDELPYIVEYRLEASLGELNTALLLDRLAQAAGVVVPVHLKINTGMNRFGAGWESAADLGSRMTRLPGLKVSGVMSHFAMSDEADKSFALEQLLRFRRALADLAAVGVKPELNHLCNSGGFLDLPEAHFNLVRLGILPLGVYPSAVCRRIDGIEPVLSVKARIVAVSRLGTGDTYGYGLRYRAPGPRRVGVLPLGYADGYPRLRDEGEVLVHGRRIPIIGGVAMDALGIDLTSVPEAGLGEEAVLLGKQDSEEITAREIARWKNSVAYDILSGWRSRLPRLYLP